MKIRPAILIAVLAFVALVAYGLHHRRARSDTAATPAAEPTPLPAMPQAPIDAKARPGTAIVFEATAACRKTPEAGGALELNLGRGDVVDVTAEQGGWLHVSTGVITCWLPAASVQR